MAAAVRVTLDIDGYSKTFEQSEIAIGRDKDNDFVVASMNVSRRHCRLRVDAGELACLDVSRGGVLERLRGEERLLTSGEWDRLTLDDEGRATLVIGDLTLAVTCVPVDEPSREAPASDAPAVPDDVRLKTMALPTKERPVARPPRTSPARGLLDALVADGKLRLDVEDEGLQRLVDLSLVFGEFLLAARANLEGTSERCGLENPLADLGRFDDASALVSAFVTGRQGRRALVSAVEELGQRDEALMAGFERGVKDLLAALDPASGTHGGRGLLGILDSSLQNYIVFFHQLADADWRDVVFGTGFIDGFRSRLQQGGDDEG